MEMIDCDCDSGAWQPRPQRFPERSRRVDRDDLHAQAPLKRPGEEPVPDAPVVPAVDHAQDLPVSRSTMVVIHDSCRIHDLASGSRKYRTDRNRCSSMPSIRGLNSSTSGRVRRQASVSAARTIHQDTANAAAVSDTARPELMTASTTWSRSRPVDRARRGTWAVDSKNESRGQPRSSQYQRYLDQSTYTTPATGMSRIRWKRRSFRRVATTPQVGSPVAGLFQR